MLKFKKSSRALIFGGLFFIIPFFLIVFAGKQIYEIFHPFGLKISEQLGLHSIFGKSSVLIITLVLLAFFFYIAGLLIEKGLVKNWGANLEKKLFVMMPSLQMLKFRLIGEHDSIITEIWQGIIFKEDNHYKIGFITEKSKDYSTIYVPDAPKIDAGEIRYMINAEFEYHEISMKEAMSALYNFGEGLDIKAIVSKSKQV